MDDDVTPEVGLTERLVDWAAKALAEAYQAGEGPAIQAFQQALAFLGSAAAALCPCMLVIYDLLAV